ncbi:MAG: hypothetical protein E7162_00695 [Firmicutes bacterium]|nr:hypothetical protein [Bacillota bacterium]
MKLCRNRFSLIKQKKIYLVFISMILLSILFGFFFYFIISDNNKLLVIDIQKNYFNGISSNNINYLSSFFNSFFTNFMYIFLIFLLGLSVVGFIFIIGIVLIKGFILGFTISSIIGTFGIKGIILSFIYVFPHQLLFLIILLLMCYYGCSFCYRLFRNLFIRTIVNFKSIKDKYLKVFVVSLIGGIVCSLYEVFIVPGLISIFI